MGRRLAWLGLVAATVAGCWSLGDGALAAPPLEPTAWSAWVEERTALEAAGAVLRLAVLAAAGYLLALTALGAAARALGWRRAFAVLARWSPPVVRWVLGAGLAGVLAVGPTAAAGASPPPTMVLVPEDEPPPPAPPPRALVAPPSPLPAPEVETVTLAPGDHLWAVAERRLAAAWARDPAEREVTPYWRLLVELNRAELPDPADPDLVFPGDVIRLPPVPR
jgi:nucleoid-associated protein YgaU